MEVPNWILEQPPGWFSWLASVATLIGLAVALWQLYFTRKAADTAVKAVGRLQRYEAASFCAEALQLLKEIRNMVHSERHELLPERFGSVRQLLKEIRGLAPMLKEHDKTELTSVETLVRNVGIRVQAPNWKDLSDNDRATTLQSLEDSIDRLVEVKVTLRRLEGTTS